VTTVAEAVRADGGGQPAPRFSGVRSCLPTFHRPSLVEVHDSNDLGDRGVTRARIGVIPGASDRILESGNWGLMINENRGRPSPSATSAVIRSGRRHGRIRGRHRV